MSAITPEEVVSIASLARLEVLQKEAQVSAEDISSILSNFSTIADIDVSDVSSSVVSGLRNVVRSDEAHSELLASTKSLMDNVPRSHDGYVQVPGVFSDSSVS